MKLAKLFRNNAKNLRRILTKESPNILTAFGVTGLLTTTILAVRATPKALYLIDRAHEDAYAYDREPPTKLDYVKLTWHLYLPTVLSGVMTTSCIIGANTIHKHRIGALASLYAITEAGIQEYQDKVVKMIGEKKELAVRDEISQDRLIKNPVTDKEVVMTNRGKSLFLETLSGRYFRSDMESVRKAVNEFNELLIGEFYQTVNEFYNMLGLDNTEMGKNTGWESDGGLLVIHYATKLAMNDEPCVVMEYRNPPKML